ncbi:hypothetical protein A2U01_0117301, partial [Trifolium medium]|nr:hypothetical protein [Trifolium medium]
MNQGSSSQSPARKLKVRPRKYNEDGSLILPVHPEPTPATSH